VRIGPYTKVLPVVDVVVAVGKELVMWSNIKISTHSTQKLYCVCVFVFVCVYLYTHLHCMYTSILDCHLTYSHKPTDLIEQDRYLKSPFLLRAVRCLLALLNTCDWVSLRISVYTFLQVCPNYTACFDVPQLPLMKILTEKSSKN